MFHVQCNHKELAIKHYVSLIVTVYYNTFGKFLFSIFFFAVWLTMLICCISCVKQNLSVNRRVIRKIQSSRILQCKQDSCYVFVTLVQCTVKSSFQSNFYLVIRCDINEQILPFVLSILPLGLEMFVNVQNVIKNMTLDFFSFQRIGSSVSCL